ncbi:MAG: ATP-binding protein, partial [Bacteroidia bacterium]
FLGKSETTGAESELFTPFAKTAKIYSRKSASNRYIPSTKIVANDVLKVKVKKALPEIQQTDFRKITESMLLSDFTPASVVINEQMDIVHIHGVITPFLEPSQGKPSFNLLKMAREGLAFELRNTLHKAKSTQTTVTKKGIPAKINGRNYLVTITIIPLPNSTDPHFLILFRKTLVVKNTNKNGDSLSEKASNNEILQRIGLEKELAQTREDMRAITEEQEAANEELQSANEELLSSSEELQSLNEELETSKEETQSSNEELMIVNQELLDKQEQINSSRLYAEAVITTVREPLVVLDNTLRIKTANNSFYSKFNITEEESEGELIYEIHNGLFDNTLLRSLLEKILPKRTQLNDYEIIIDLPTHGECTMLLNARQIVNEKNKEQLILIAIEDINERRILEKRKKEFAEELESKVKERTLQLEQINLQLDQFTHTTSHEFQEPLRKIATFSKILQDNKNKLKPELIQEYLNKIEAASIRMTALTQDMLNFAGVASHERLFIKTDLNEILKNILFDFELLIEEKKAKIICGKLPEIEAVPFQMNQLFYDIIHNALKFSKGDVPPIIEISSHKLSKEEIKDNPKLNQKLNYYEIVFKDNGIGFDQKYARQIFTMFQRLSSGGIYPGTGIGLALCKKIVQTYSGKIFAQGKENKGASFHVILPIEQPVSEASETVVDEALTKGVRLFGN